MLEDNVMYVREYGMAERMDGSWGGGMCVWVIQMSCGVLLPGNLMGSLH